MCIKELWLKGLPAQDPPTLASMAQLGPESLVGWVPSCLLSPIPPAAMGACSNNTYNSDRQQQCTSLGRRLEYRRYGRAVRNILQLFRGKVTDCVAT